MRFAAHANFNDVNRQVQHLQNRVALLQKQFAVTPGAGGLIDPAKVQANARALDDIRARYLTTLNAQGQFAVQSGKVTTATEQFTNSLSKQKLAIGQTISNLSVLKNVYREQLALQNMATLQWKRDGLGGVRADMIIPRELPKSIDTVTQRLGFMNTVLAANSTQMINWGKNVQWAGRQLTVGFTVPFSIVAGMAGKLAYDVESQLVRIEKVYDTVSTNAAGKAAELSRLRSDSFTLASNAANQYGSSLEGVLDVEAGLAATGVKGRDLLKQTDQVVRLATLGEIEYQQSLEMSIALQNAFGLSTEQLTEKMNFFNSVENATSLSIGDIAEAIPRAATSMAGLGVTVEEMIVLLVAMKERGVDAAEGANALKSATARLVRPTPRAQEVFRENFGVDIMEIAQRNAGNLFDILKELAVVFEGADNFEKMEAITELFGTYQLNRLNSALGGITEAIAAPGEQSSQTARAMEEMLRTPGEHAQTATGELQRWQQSASGQIKRAIETFKAELAELGQSFLPIIATIIKAGSSVVSWFNNLPDGVKKVVLFTAAIVGITGPLVMIIGLMANLVGNVLKAGTFLAGLALKFKIVNADQQAAALLAKAASVSFSEEARSAKLLADTLMVTNEQLATTAALQKAQAGPPLIANVRDKATGATSKYDMRTGMLIGPDTVSNSKLVSAEAEKTGRNWSGIAKAAAGMGAAVLAFSMMSGSSSELVGHLQTALIVATLIGPAVARGLRGAFASSAATSMFGPMMTKIKGIGSAITTRFGGAMKGTMTAVRALGGAFAGLAGPIGIAAAAAGLIALKVHSEVKKAREEQQKIEQSANDWADALGYVQLEVGEIVNEEGEVEKTLQSIKATMMEENPGLANSMRAAKDEAEALNVAIQEGIKVIQTGGSPEQARQAVEAMLRMIYSEAKTKELMMKINLDFGNMEEVAKEQAELFAGTFSRIVSNEFEQSGWESFGRFFTGTNELNARAREAAKGAAQQFYGAIQAADEKEGAQIFANVMGTVSEQQSNFFKGIQENYGDELAKAGIDTYREFERAINNMSNDSVQNLMKFGDLAGVMDDSRGQVMMFADAERTLAQEMLRSAGYTDEVVNSVNTLSEARSKLNILMTPEAAEAQYKLAVSVLESTGQYEKLNDKQRLNILNMNRAMAGLGAVTSLEDGFKESVKGTTDALDENSSAIEDSAQNMEEWASAVVEATKSAFGGARDFALQQADQIMQEQHQEQIDSIQAAGQRRDDALDAAAEAAEERFDARRERSEARYEAAMLAFDAKWERMMDAHTAKWERRNDAAQAAHDRRLQSIDDQIEKEREASDRRIEALDSQIERERERADRVVEAIDTQIQKEREAEEQRKRIFEAERTRIQRLQSMFKSTVDLDIALNSGDLDQAAKLMADSEAQQEQWMLDDLEQVQGSATERRIKNLEKQKKAAQELSKERIKILEREKKAEKRASDARIKQLQKQREAMEKTHKKRMDDLKKLQAEEKKALDKKKKRDQEAIKSARDRYNKELEAERKRYRKGLDAARKANREETASATKAANDRLAIKKRNLELELQAIRASTPRNKREYNRQINQIEKVYNKYGVRLKNKGDRWTKTIGNGLTRNIRSSAAKLRDDIKWKKYAKEIADKITNGALGMTVKDFKKWIRTGQLPEINGRPRSRPGNSSINQQAYHSGGPINSGSSSRVGYPASASKFPSEVDIRAQAGEYMMTKRAHRMYGTDFMDAVNNGKLPKDIGGPDLGFAGLMVGMIAGAMKHALVEQITSTQDLLMGFSVATEPGKYGNVSLNAEQLQNAGIISQVGYGLGASYRDVLIALMTAMQESTLRNLNYGDRDSIGLFQQRNAWGSREDRLNPFESARMFFEGGRGGQRGLFDFKDRDQMSLTQAAQAVQVSAFPSAYAKWEDMARAILSGGGAIPPAGPGGFIRPVSGPITSKYGMRRHPITGQYKLHDGTDIAAPRGTMVKAAQSGRVARASYATGYGNWVILDHAGGLQTAYAHLDGFRVGAGQMVGRGQGLGPVGMTGYTTGPHLHMMVGKSGNWVNPGNYIPGLMKGGEIKYDNTIANLHKKETVLTAPLSRDLKEGISKIKNDGGITYKVEIHDNVFESDIDVEKAVERALLKKEKKAGPNRRVGGN